MERPLIKQESRSAQVAALVAMEPGHSRDAVVAVLVGIGAEVATTEVRGRGLLETLVHRHLDVLVVELSRLGEVGLRGLAETARRCPQVVTVLLLPGGLGGPGAASLGIAGVLVESDLAGLRDLLGAAVSGAEGQAC